MIRHKEYTLGAHDERAPFILDQFLRKIVAEIDLLWYMYSL